MPSTNTITLDIKTAKHGEWILSKSGVKLVKTQAVAEVPPPLPATPKKPVDHYNVFIGLLIVIAILTAIVWGLRRVNRRIDTAATLLLVGFIWWIFGRK